MISHNLITVHIGKKKRSLLKRFMTFFPDIHFHLCIFLKSTNNDAPFGFNIGGGIKEPPTCIYVDHIDETTPENMDRLLR